MFKMKLLNLLLIPAILLVACSKELEPQESCNFVRNAQKQRVSWKSTETISVAVHSSVPKEYLGAIEESIEIWENRLGLDLFEFYEIVDDQEIDQYDIEVYWLSSWEEDRKKEQARTSIHWSSNNLYAAEIAINAKDNRFFTNNAESGKVDLVALLVHEFGHALGLDHIDGPQTVMAPKLAQNDDSRRVPYEIDVQSLSCEY